MPRAGRRKWLVIFKRQPTATNEYNEGEASGSATVIARREVEVRFGTAQEKREAAQEGGIQTATFHCKRSPTLDGVLLSDVIEFDGSDWDITERAPLNLDEIRFTGSRNL